MRTAYRSELPQSPRSVLITTLQLPTKLPAATASVGTLAPAISMAEKAVATIDRKKFLMGSLRFSECDWVEAWVHLARAAVWRQRRSRPCLGQRRPETAFSCIRDRTAPCWEH